MDWTLEHEKDGLHLYKNKAGTVKITNGTIPNTPTNLIAKHTDSGYATYWIYLPKESQEQCIIVLTKSGKEDYKYYGPSKACGKDKIMPEIDSNEAFINWLSESGARAGTNVIIVDNEQEINKIIASLAKSNPNLRI